MNLRHRPESTVPEVRGQSSHLGRGAIAAAGGQRGCDHETHFYKRSEVREFFKMARCLIRDRRARATDDVRSLGRWSCISTESGIPIESDFGGLRSIRSIGARLNNSLRRVINIHGARSLCRMAAALS